MSGQRDYVILHPRWVRYTHWICTSSVIILIGSGWRIYNQELITGFGSPMFEFLNFPVWITIGGDYEGAERGHNDFGLAGALLWHFAAMWLLFGSITAYAIYGIASGYFRRNFVRIRFSPTLQIFYAANSSTSWVCATRCRSSCMRSRFC